MAKIFVKNFIFQPKRKKKAEWTGENPILRDGEFGIVTDGADGEWLKFGDGVTAWNSLPYKKGPKGDTGPQGEKGDKGDTGAQGPQGLKGDKGDPGEQGTQGIQGIQGLKGDKGEDGYTPQKGVDYFTDEDIASLNIPLVDQTYTPTSENAQSGKAVAEAVSTEQKRADNTFANALKGSKSGSATLIDDASPVEHTMTVKVSSDTVADLTAVKVKKQGKNLVPFPYRDLKLGTSTYNGVDFTVYEDGSILINGTATISTSKYLYGSKTGMLGLKSGITISGSKNASDDTQQANVYFICNYYDSTGTMKQGLVVSTTSIGKMTITNDWKGLGIYINVPKGKTLNNLLIKPQLEIGTTATDYEPYITPTEYTPTADGAVNGVTSLYPSTTLTTDTNGVMIDCEYNRDINKFIDLTEYVKQTDIDQAYSPNSENAQSGKAVAEAVTEAKGYTDTKIGSIDTVLDNIIALQNSYIGGNA